MSEEYRVAASEAVELVARLLDKGDVTSVSVHDVDGDLLVVLPGTTPAEQGAQRLLDAFQEGGGGATLTVVAEMGPPTEDLVSARRVVADAPAYPEGEEPEL